MTNPIFVKSIEQKPPCRSCSHRTIKRDGTGNRDCLAAKVKHQSVSEMLNGLSSHVNFPVRKNRAIKSFSSRCKSSCGRTHQSVAICQEVAQSDGVSARHNFGRFFVFDAGEP